MSHTGSCIWTLGSQLLALFEEVMEPLRQSLGTGFESLQSHHTSCSKLTLPMCGQKFNQSASCSDLYTRTAHPLQNHSKIIFLFHEPLLVMVLYHSNPKQQNNSKIKNSLLGIMCFLKKELDDAIFLKDILIFISNILKVKYYI